MKQRGFTLIELMIVVAIIGILAAVFLGDRSKKNFLKDNGCVLQHEQPTGNKVMCGKACVRDELRKEYSCSNLQGQGRQTLIVTE